MRLNLFCSERAATNKFLYPGILGVVFVLLVLAGVVGSKDVNIEVFFSPRDECSAQILSYLNAAEESIDIAMFYFTNRILAQALVKARERGVAVRVYLDGGQRGEKYSKGRYLENNNVPVRYEDGAGLMHDKFCIIDGSMVITGSFNWTVTADLKNDENLLIVNSEEVAARYAEHFERFWVGTYVDECKYTDETRLKKIQE